MLTIDGGGGSPTVSSNDGGGTTRTLNGSGVTPLLTYTLSRGGGGMPFRMNECK